MLTKVTTENAIQLDDTVCSLIK